MLCYCTAFFVTDIRVRPYDAGRELCVAAPKAATAAQEFPHADSQRQAHPSQESIQIGVRLSEGDEASLDASWFTDKFGDDGLVHELQSERIPATHDAQSYRRWNNSEVMRSSVSEGPMPMA